MSSCGPSGWHSKRGLPVRDLSEEIDPKEESRSYCKVPTSHIARNSGVPYIIQTLVHTQPPSFVFHVKAIAPDILPPL